MKIIIFLLLLLITCSNSLYTAQYNALVSINTILNQDWDVTLNTICSQTKFQCDSTGDNIQNLYLVNPIIPISLPVNDIIEFTNLEGLGIDTNIVFGASFWAEIGRFTMLKQIGIQTLTEDLPTNIGEMFPRTLNSLVIERSQFIFPDSLFTKSNLSTVYLATFNTADYDIFPIEISAPSTIKTLAITNTGSLKLKGTNFTNLNYLSLTHSLAGNPMTYNLFDTWKCRQINVQYSSNLILSEFPSSLLINTDVTFITFRAENRMLLGSTTVLDFSGAIQLTSLELRNFNILPQLTYPGIIFANNTIDRFGHIYLSPIDYTVLNIFSFAMLDLMQCTYINNLPIGNYSQMSAFSIMDDETTPLFSGPVPDELCNIKSYFSMHYTTVTTLPQCFSCEWGNPDFDINFSNNPSLIKTYSCPNFQFLNYSNLLPTKGGLIDISGVDLGWKIYDQNNVLYTYQRVKVGNELLSVEVADGTGLGKTLQVKFHAISNPSAQVYTLNYNYMPPTITSFNAASNYLYIQGDNFYYLASKVKVWVAGKPLVIYSPQFNNIVCGPDAVPYNNNLTISITVDIDGQSDSKIIRAAGFAPQLFQPFPKLYSGGGFVQFTGQYLTYDTTIMNLTINGLLFSDNITQATAESYMIKYSPIARGNYTLVYNLLEYQVTGTIEVTDDPPCVVVPANGYCLGITPVCIKPWTGPDCGSIPANLTRPPILDSNPFFKTNSEKSQWKGESSSFTYSYTTTSLTEVDEFGNVVNGNFLPLPQTRQPDQNSTDKIQSVYISGPLHNTSSLINILSWYIDYFDSYTNFGQPTIEVPSTFGYLNGIMAFPFTSPTNHLELTFQLELEIVNPDIPLCSRVEIASLPTTTGVDYIKLKINYIDYYLRIYKTAMQNSANQLLPLNYTTRTITQQAQKIVQEVTIFIDPWVDNYYIYEFDLTMLYDSKSAAQESSPKCSSFTPTPTSKPSDKPCPGDPVCGGSSQGQCVNSHCQCISPWRGVQCDSKPDIIPPVIPNPETPTINSTKDEIGFHISIISLRELNFNGVLEREQYLSNWTVIETKTEQKQTFYYKNNVFGNSSTNNDTIVFVTIDYFYVDTQVEFAGETSTKSAGTIKYSANVTSWPFLKKTNQLQIVFSSSAQDNTESSDSCTVKNVEYSQNQQDNVEVVYFQVNDKTFQSKFIDDAIVDGTIRQIKNVELPNVVNDSNTLSSSLIGILTPYHNEYVLIDPDFSLLISYVPPKEKEGSICSEKSKKKLSNAQIAGIVVGGFVFLVSIIAIIVYAIRFNMRKKALVRTINQKIQAVNNHNKN
ncbi:EGF-like domain-containing protein [Tieghemostelium lacteum]|uniref:EGF-like domain-containing protein n=1 Tax=Tieghemostelium lacteum TaxID=361077 RepID=A0A151ZIH0_TIELA|nr:EGF-like domain-containing protein [Tieghemostelium lacteum]|eukprot:KYQ93644.1 EGF-like domain-containing protein [Tieghemostelium lacteum]